MRNINPSAEVTFRVIAEYLAAALQDPNPDVFLQAVADVARARGMSRVAKDAGLEGRASTRHSRRVRRSATTRCANWWIPLGYG